MRGPAFNPRLGRVRLWRTKWHWDRFLSHYFCFLCQYHSAIAPLTFIYRLPILWMPLNDTHLELIVNQMNPLYIPMPGFLKLDVIVVSTSGFPKWVSSPVSPLKYVHVACFPIVLHDRYSWHRPISGSKGFSPIRQELGTMRRPSYENAAVYHCAGAQTADIGGQAGRRIRCKFVVLIPWRTDSGRVWEGRAVCRMKPQHYWDAATFVCQTSRGVPRRRKLGHVSRSGLGYFTGRWNGCDQTPAYVTVSLSDGSSDPYCLPVFSSQLFGSVTNLIIVCSQTWHK